MDTDERADDDRSVRRRPDGRRTATSAVTIPVDDPIAALPPTAVRVLQAAQRVLAERGFEGLTLSSVAEESGENKAMTAYYFGNKQGLVRALLDSIVHDECLGAASRMREVPEGDRLDRIVAEMRAMSAAGDQFLTYFSILPHALRDPELRERLAILYEWYFEIKLDWFGLDREADAERRRQLRGVVQLMSAIIDGLAVQTLIDPGRFDPEEAMAAFGQLLTAGLPEADRQRPAAAAAAGDRLG